MLTNLSPDIVQSEPKILVGKRIQTTLMANETSKLWQSFMPFKNDILNRKSEILFSIENYKGDFLAFTPETPFEKWAAMEVSEINALRHGMEICNIPAGLYAVFVYKGTDTDVIETFQYIFQTWLPTSIYALDNRPHFGAMGDKYIRNHPDSEEELWIPIKLKNT